MLEAQSGAHRSVGAVLLAVQRGWYRERMSLRGQALQEFDLPAAPQRVDELVRTAPDADAMRVQAPAGRFLLLCGSAALSLAFEATLFDLLSEARYPAPRPRRARGGSLIAVLGPQLAASCYPWPAGELITAADASVPLTHPVSATHDSARPSHAAVRKVASVEEA